MMYKAGQTFLLIYFSLFHKIGSFLTLYFLCYANYVMKTKGSVNNVHLNFRGKICKKKVSIIQYKLSNSWYIICGIHTPSYHLLKYLLMYRYMLHICMN